MNVIGCFGLDVGCFIVCREGESHEQITAQKPARMKTKKIAMSICPLCDAHYDDSDAEEVKIHDHPAPQSGPMRDAWIRSGLEYYLWTRKTPEGREWAEMRRQKTKRGGMIEHKLEPRQCLPCEVNPTVETDVTGATSIKCDECYREVIAHKPAEALRMWNAVMVEIENIGKQKGEVYQRPECIFMYCPDPANCLIIASEPKCQHLVSNEGGGITP